MSLSYKNSNLPIYSNTHGVSLCKQKYVCKENLVFFFSYDVHPPAPPNLAIVSPWAAEIVC